MPPSTYAPTSHLHAREGSDASSVYSAGNRLSTFQAYQAYQKQTDRSASAASTETYGYNFSLSNDSNRTSMIHPSSTSTGQVDEGHRPSEPTGLLMPTADGKESRLSEFYDVYYRNSVIPPHGGEIKKTVIDRQSTILEVDSPMPSPLLPKTHQAGAAF